MKPVIDPVRSSARANAEKMLDEKLGDATQPGWYGRLVLNVRDGIAEKLDVEQTLNIPRLKSAA